MTLEEIKRDSEIYALRKLGHFVSVDRIFREDDKWIVKLKIDYPLIIRDDVNPDDYIRKFVRLLDIGDLVYTNKRELIRFPERISCISKVQNRLAYWHDKLEQIIISVSSHKLAKIRRLSNFWNPIYFIVSCLVDEERVTYDDLKAVSPSNIFNYMELLESLNLVKIEDDVYTYSQLFSLKLKEYGGDEKLLRDWVVSYVIQNRYDTVKNIFNITQMIPFIRTENSYYQPSLNADELVHKSLSSITNYYNNSYGKISQLDVKYWLKELIDVDIITQRRRLYYGNEDLFEEMMKHKKLMQNRIPPLINIPKGSSH